LILERFQAFCQLGNHSSQFGNFATEFMTARSVSTATLAAAKAVLGGDRGVVDLVGTMGLYQISSMMVALDETPLPNGVKPYLHPAK